MANKKQNTNKKSVQKAPLKAVEDKKKKRTGTEKFLIIFAAIALVAIIASIIVGVVVSSRANYRTDFLNDDLSKLIYVAESDYRDFEVEVKVDPVDDYDIDNAILQALCKNKAKDPKYNGIYLKNQTITPGDKITLYYRGYTKDENGNKVDFDGGCNFSGNAGELEIGSGSFVPGFELGLVGKNPKDYGTFTKYDSTGVIKEGDRIVITYVRKLGDGTVMAKKYDTVNLADGKEKLDAKYGTKFYSNIVGQQYGIKLPEFEVETDNGVEKFSDVIVYRSTSVGDLIQITYSAFYFDGGLEQGKSALIDLNDPTLDERFGEGFADFFNLGVPVGTKAVNSSGAASTLNTTTKDGKNSFFEITVSNIYKIEGDPLVVEAHFPEDYANSASLQGVTAYFDVFVLTTQVYEAPEYNDAFITETLKLTAEDLKDYEGESLTDKYTAKLKKELEDKYTKSLNTALDSAILAHLLEKAEIRRLPEKDVREFYDSYYNDIMSQYSYYSSYYDSVDKFAREYMGLSSNADWRAELKKTAENTLAQKLAFYYVVRRENLVISDEEFANRYEDAVEEYFVSYLENVNCKRENYDSDEEYEKAKADYKKTMLEYYTEDYFRENIIYEYALETLRTYVKIK